MAQKIFVNILVESAALAAEFYTALGLTLNEMMSDDQATCVAVSEDIALMFMERDKLKQMTSLPLAERNAGLWGGVAITRETREEVDAILERGIAAGGSEHGSAEDYGFMYSRGLIDPNGNVIDFNWIDPTAMEGQE